VTLSPSSVSSSASLNGLPQHLVVTFENGALTVSAHGATSGSIVRLIGSQTGAEIEIASQADEPVVAELGPGSARDVLRTLLVGSRFNYILVGSTTDPTALTKVVLLPKLIAERGSTPETNISQPALRDGDQQPETASLPEFVYQGDSSQGSMSSIRDQQRMLQQFRQAVLGNLRQEHTPK